MAFGWAGFPSRTTLDVYSIHAVVDLSAELSADRGQVVWQAFPCLDLTVVPASTLCEVVESIVEQKAHGRVLVCCALGYSRSAAAVCCWLVKSGHAGTLTQAVEMVGGVRPDIVLGREQLDAISVAVDESSFRVEEQNVKIGLCLPSESDTGAPMLERLDVLIESTRMARDYGFDTVQVGQHYVQYPLQVLQPIPLLGRLAAESGDMQLGTCILLLPLLHPVDVAEQVATLDHLCGGRFIFGIGLGYLETEFHAFGVDKKRRVSRFEESLAVIKQMWTQDEVNFEGKTFQH